MSEKANQSLTQEEIVKKFMEKPAVVSKVKPSKKADNNESKQLEDINNVVVLPNGYKIKINPTKLKYFKNGDFATCSLIKSLGLITLITKYVDGYDVLGRFLSAVFDKPYKEEQYLHEGSTNYESKFVFDEYITNLIDNELSPVDIENIIETSLKVNHLDAESFFLPLLNTMG